MNDKIKINLQIADSNYPLTINREEEEMVREAAKQVNIRLNAYREYYKNLEPEKIIAMVAYQFSLEKLQLMQRNDTTPYTEWYRYVALIAVSPTRTDRLPWQ